MEANSSRHQSGTLLLWLILHNREHNNIGQVYALKFHNKVLSHTAPISISLYHVVPEFWSVENTFKQLLYWTSREVQSVA